MKIVHAALALGATLAPITLVHAQAPAAAVTGDHYTTASTPLGVLLDDPASLAVLDKRLPGLSTNPQIGGARSMTLRDLQKFTPDKLTDTVLAGVDTDLAALPVKK